MNCDILWSYYFKNMIIKYHFNVATFYITEPPKERPRLKLLPKQTDKTDGGDEHESSTKSSIFGSAKPVDTAKKEAEIDQKLQVSPVFNCFTFQN